VLHGLARALRMFKFSQHAWSETKPRQHCIGERVRQVAPEWSSWADCGHLPPWRIA
jgi:hypothetical protein